MRTVQTTGVENPDDPAPWYDVEIADGVPEITADRDGFTNVNLSGERAETPAWSDAPDPAARGADVDVSYYVIQTGAFVAVPSTDAVGEVMPTTLYEECLQEQEANLAEHGLFREPTPIRLKLAEYDAADDEFTILEFAER